MSFNQMDTPEVHPICLLLPDMTADEFASLKDDIAQHGLIRPVLLYEGKILDGRHRARACDELGVNADYTTWAGDDPVTFVLSENLHRRHLSISQRAMIAARAIDRHKECAEVRMKAGKTPASFDATPPQTGKAAATAAAAAGVSTASVERACQIVRDGTPEDVLEVAAGLATVSSKAGEILERKQPSPAYSQTPFYSKPQTGYLKTHVSQCARLRNAAKAICYTLFI